MNASINLPQLDKTDQHTKEHRVKIGCRDIIHICAAPISMVLPIIICLLLQENLIKYNILPKLLILIPPFLYSGVHCLIMFNKNRTEQSESPSTLSSALHSLTNITLLLFSLISLLSIIALSIINTWGKDVYAFLSAMLPFLLASTYLLDTSCSLTRSNFQYTTANSLDILLDLLIFFFTSASIITNRVSEIDENTYMLASTILPAILILIRSWREKYRPSAKYNGPAKLWRAAIPIIILVSTAIAYGFMGFISLYILNQTSSGPLKA
ncbi:DUF2463 domain-containing protein [Encephalitozoon hellem]|uniref:DUF2463 domain-containing protein n=1 Tax=Encephalitozoon hellem TaxID=27973 RepID=A0ABY8CLJ2_ENCHE|nr:DUF2463 domain-containing protein [Encephalitozoon hellem]WEL38325.1 DUF2463 domain-containing protein [Encephalitozoon hellem]WEL38526.1 DUF2463 domain-containing protein [Encephalitozoon hellem]